MDRITGTVKFFNTTKGYGFVQPEDGSKDVFVHISALEQAGFHGLWTTWWPMPTRLSPI